MREKNASLDKRNKKAYILKMITIAARDANPSKVLSSSLIHQSDHLRFNQLTRPPRGLSDASSPEVEV